MANEFRRVLSGYPESAVSGKALRPLEGIHLIVFLGIRGYKPQPNSARWANGDG